MAPAGANPGAEGHGRKPGPGEVRPAERKPSYGGVWAKEDAMNKLVQFVKESYAELRKVVWPGRDDAISSVKVVIVSTIIFAVILGLVDMLLLLGVQAIF